MSIVKFPGLGLEFNISKIAFQIGNIIVYKYAVCIVLRNYFGINFSEI
ncbi:MAG: hypothetical protein IJ629_06295 [Clostridia bacterium]|nr:hypothetical protein [Clostridia bacterium]